jgi:hypothetical protein
MKLVAWSTDEAADAEVSQIETLEELWQVVRSRQDAMDDEEESSDGVQEISANTDTDETPYLVLAWVEAEPE